MAVHSAASPAPSPAVEELSLFDIQEARSDTHADPVQPVAAVGPPTISDFELIALMHDLGVDDSRAEGDDLDAGLMAGQEEDVSAAGTVWSGARIAEHVPAGPGVASLLAASVPRAATDWELPGIASNYRRLAAWAQAGELAAVAEIAARSAAANPRIGTDEDGRPDRLPPEAAAQVALEMQMSQPAAADWVDLAIDLRWRLPLTGTSLSAGVIDLARARIIAEGTAVLPDELVSAVEERVLPNAADQTTGQLRGAVRRAVLAADPTGAEQRRKDTERRAKVALYPDENGAATLTGSSLPGVHAAAAMARITAMARALKSSGAEGGLDLLRAHIYLGLLLGTMPLIPPPADGPPNPPPPPDDSPSAEFLLPDPPPSDAHSPDSPSPDSPSPDSPGAQADSRSSASEDRAAGRPGAGGPARSPRPDQPDCPGGDESPPTPWQDIPPPADRDAPPDDSNAATAADMIFPDPHDTEEDDRAEVPSPDWPTLPAQVPGGATAPSDRDGSPRPPAAGLLDVLVPWSALTGQASEPARLSRIGPVTSLQAQQLLVLAARSPQTEWRIVLTDGDGCAAAVERGRPTWHPRSGRSAGTQRIATTETGVVGRVTIVIRETWLTTQSATHADCPLPLREIVAMAERAAARAAARLGAERAARSGSGDRGCAHTRASACYRPPPRLRELVAARDLTCRFGPCGQPAWRTDLDHTVPWHKGGRTCSCNLGGCCRTHHKIKQLPGWSLRQPRPGVFVWTTSAGRSYLVQPDRYPA